MFYNHSVQNTVTDICRWGTMGTWTWTISPSSLCFFFFLHASIIALIIFFSLGQGSRLWFDSIEGTLNIWLHKQCSWNHTQNNRWSLYINIWHVQRSYRTWSLAFLLPLGVFLYGVKPPVGAGRRSRYSSAKLSTLHGAYRSILSAPIWQHLQTFLKMFAKLITFTIILNTRLSYVVIVLTESNWFVANVLWILFEIINKFTTNSQHIHTWTPRLDLI